MSAAPYNGRHFAPSGASWLRWLTIALVGLGAVFVLGLCQGASRARVQFEGALRTAKATSDSLQRDLRVQLDSVHRDTVRRDSIITRWRVARAQVETLPPVQLPGRVDTVPGAAPALVPLSAIPLIQLADTTIRGLEDVNRRCVSVLSNCEVALKSTTTRAEFAEAHAARLEAAAGRAARWRAYERGACVASLAGNILAWRSR